MMNVKKTVAVSLVFSIILTMLVSFQMTAIAADTEIIEQISKMYDLRSNGNYEECIKIADNLLATDNTLMEAYYNKSTAYYLMNKKEDALEVLKKQLLLNPKNARALYNAACACSAMGRSDQAIEYLRQVLGQDISTKKDIIKDSDFDSIRHTEAYKKLMGLSVVVGGEVLNLQVPPLNKDGRTMLPLRGIFEALGAKITWNGTTKTVTAVKGKITTSLTIDKKTALVNGVIKEMDVPSMIKDGSTFIPVRFASEALGAKVNWNPEDQVIEIITSAPEGRGNDYETIKKEMNGLTIVSVVDGIWPEPYSLPDKEGTTIIIAKDKKAIDLMNSLDLAARAKYMYEATYDNYALVIGCSVVHMKFVYDGKVYYSGDMYYDKKGEGIELTYYEKGLPINVVKQYKSKFNYKDYYLLPESEKTTSKIGD